MKILFIHRNMPGQFRHLAPRVAALGHETVFITRRGDRELPGVRRVTYQPLRAPRKDVHPYLRGMEDAVLHGQQVLRTCIELGGAGFVPHLVVAHPGWGESLFVKEVFPDTPLINYGEFYFRPDGPMNRFDPETPHDVNGAAHTRMANAHLLVAMETADLGWSPTEWQRSTFPACLQPRIRTVFDGIDTSVVTPDAGAKLALADGRVLTAAHEVITYVSRNLEPVRGFPTFMKALPAILKARPRAQVVIAGADGISYGVGKTTPVPWRERMLAEVDLPPGRVHFTGPLPYETYLDLLRISSCHVYLTWPFVLSWSLMEAMSAGCLIVASGTDPVREVIRDGENGLLTDFFDEAQVAERVIFALGHPRTAALRRAARRTVVNNYALDLCLPKQMALLGEASGRDWAGTGNGNEMAGSPPPRTLSP